MSQDKSTNAYIKAKLAAWRNKKNQSSSTTSIQSAPAGMAIPLTYGQERIWFLQQLYPDNPFYHYCDVLELKGNLDLSRLIGALSSIIKRHSILRTIITDREGSPFQEIRPSFQLPFNLVDLSGADDSQHELLLREKVLEEIQQPFDLAKGPLLRISLVKLNANSHRLIATLHHIITDGGSMSLFLKELKVFYRGDEIAIAALPEFTIQYSDFAYWQRKTPIPESHLTYWIEKLKGAPTIWSFPFDFPRPKLATYKGAYFSKHLPSNISHRAKELAKEYQTTPFVFLLTVFKILIHRYTNEEDILVGTPISNRDQPQLEPLMGFFNETQVLRNLVSGEMTFESVLNQIKNTVLEALSHKDVPFEMLVKSINPDRQEGANPLFQAMFLYRDEPMDDSLEDGLTLLHKPFDFGVSKFDLTLYISEHKEELFTLFEYSTALFKKETIQQLQTSFLVLLEGIIANPKQKIGYFPIVSAASIDQQFNQWNQTSVELPEFNSINELWKKWMRDTPEAIAIHFKEEAITYGTLAKLSNGLALRLKEEGVQPGMLVGVCFPRSIEMIVAIVGVLEAGGAYVPLDPNYPKDRILYMVEDAKVQHIVTHPRVASLFEEQNVQLTVWENKRSENPIPEKQSVRPTNLLDSLAYVIYTSGSSGTPKGVPITHKNLIHSTLARDHFYDTNPKAFLLLSSFSFDSSVAGIFWTLCTGGQLVITEKGVEQDIVHLSWLFQKYQVSHTLMLPSLYELLLQHGSVENLESLDTVIVAGESCLPSLVQLHFQKLPQTQIYNEYGPTEATVWCIAHQMTKADRNGAIPIGRPIANTQSFVLDKNKLPVPIGAEGELYIGGEGLSSGYLFREDLSQKRFIEFPLTENQNIRLYQTGDLVRYRRNGILEFRGRADNQVKIRGHRVELDEIANCLKTFSNINDALVIVASNPKNKNSRITAYVVGEQKTDHIILKNELRDRLPDYMIPDDILWLKSFPKLPNGKINRHSLPKPDFEATREVSNYVPPETELEKKLAAIWEEVLDYQPIGIQQNFFEVGGDSLLSIKVIAKVNQAGIELTPQQLLHHKTISSLAQLMESPQNEGKNPTQTPSNNLAILNPEYLPLKLNPTDIQTIIKQLEG